MMKGNEKASKMVQRPESKREVMTLKIDSLSANEEFARVVVAVFASRMNPTLEEILESDRLARKCVNEGV